MVLDCTSDFAIGDNNSVDGLGRTKALADRRSEGAMRLEACDSPGSSCSRWRIVRYCRILEDTCDCPRCRHRAKLAGGPSLPSPPESDTPPVLRTAPPASTTPSPAVPRLF